MYTVHELAQLLHAADPSITVHAVAAQVAATNPNRIDPGNRIDEHTRLSHTSAEAVATALGVTTW